MIKQKTILTLDTETVGLQPQNYVYDLAYTIHNKRGDIIIERSFLVRDIITDADKMMGAYFAKKIFSFYIPALDSGEAHLANWSDVAAQLADDVKNYKVDVIAAYNARFDIGAISATHSLLSSGKVLDAKIDLLCIWHFTCRVLLNRPTYQRLAWQQNWVSDAKNIRTTAEHTYRYITGDYDFIESHTALDDARRETEILARCFAQKKSIPYNDFGVMPWRIPQCDPNQFMLAL